MGRPGTRSATEFLGAFETTYLPAHGVDVADVTGHATHWQSDVDFVLESGVSTLRYALRWHRIEAEPGVFDWSTADAALNHLHDVGADPIVDLVHHTSYPDWLVDGFRDRRFPDAFLRYAEAVAQRYPWLSSYTLFNEPFATLFLAGHEALWPPYDRGMPGFIRLVRNVLPAIVSAAQLWRDALPRARHVWVDTAESHRGAPGGPADYAALANDRRHILLDLALHHDLEWERPFLREFVRAGGADLLDLPPISIDILGLDYYCHSEWWYDDDGGHSPSPQPLGFAAVAAEYGAHHGIPMMLTETNLRGLPSDRASWLRYMLEQYEIAVAGGIDLRGFCWFPTLDSSDWDSLLARAAGRIDPVGVLTLLPDGTRLRTVFTEAWLRAANGAAAATLPAYRFQPPCDIQLAGFLPNLTHWPWQDPPPENSDPIVHTTLEAHRHSAA